MRRLKKGDKVRVWSLQSWSDGGFLEGEPAVVRQDQGVGPSVVLAVVRNFNGNYKLDEAYEVYTKQCELMEEQNIHKCSDYELALKDLEAFRKKIMGEH